MMAIIEVIITTTKTKQLGKILYFAGRRAVTYCLATLRLPQRAVQVDRSRENDFTVVTGRRRGRGNFGHGREGRIVGRRRVHLHLVADRERRVQSAPVRIPAAEVRRIVFGRWLLTTNGKGEVANCRGNLQIGVGEKLEFIKNTQLVITHERGG